MKKFADAKRSERKFKIGDWVYLKLQPYRHLTVQGRRNAKLAPKYYVPFEIVAKFGSVAYELKLPEGSLIHHVFHVSQLKERIGNEQAIAPVTPLTYPNSTVKEKPEGILGRRMVRRDNVFNQEILVKWKNATEEEASWEDYEVIREKFPEFILRDKDIFKGEGVSVNKHSRLLAVGQIDLVKLKEEEGKEGGQTGQALLPYSTLLSEGAHETGSSCNKRGQKNEETLTGGPYRRDVNSLNGVKVSSKTENTDTREGKGDQCIAVVLSDKSQT